MTKMSQKPTKNDIVLIANELKFARFLADNNKTTRDKALKTLKKWLQHSTKTTQLTDDDFMVLWKGLFYSMWMSDKLLVQEECAESISSLVHCLATTEQAISFYKCGILTLMQEWFGIDQFRLDKFLMLARRLLRQMLFVLKKTKWIIGTLTVFCDALSTTILNHSLTNSCLGLRMHFIEIYLEELAKVSEGEIKPEAITTLLRPFMTCLATSKDGRISGHIRKFIFVYLMRQSDLGLEYQARYDAWKQEGFPGSIDSMQRIKVDKGDDDQSDDDEEQYTNKDKPLDPRAGRVDVELPQLKFSPKLLVTALSEIKFLPNSSQKTRQAIGRLTQQFQMMASGVYPLGIKRLNLPKDDYDTNIRKSVNRLVKFERKVMGNSKKNKHINVNKQHEQKHDKVSKRKLTEGTGQVNHKKRKLTDKMGDPEYVFVRNSGTWFVFDTSKLTDQYKQEESVQENGIGDNSADFNCSIEQHSESQQNEKSKECIKKKKQKHQQQHAASFNQSYIESPLKNHTPNSPKGDSPHTEKAKIKIGSPLNSDNNQSSPVKLLFEDSTQNIKNMGRELFPKSEWDEPLQDGEYEICIPSKKHINKLKRLSKTKRSSSMHESIISDTLQIIRGKNRLSLDSRLVQNPFSTPTSENDRKTKRVKINTKLNRSQEIQEHIEGILKSPAIPYDANKKPEKPLLKRQLSVSSPINPFYKQLDV